MAESDHKRGTAAHRKHRAAFIAAPLAALATAVSVGVGVLSAPAEQQTTVASADRIAPNMSLVREATVSRSEPRPTTPKPSPATKKATPTPTPTPAPKPEPKPDPMAPALVAKAVANATTELWTTTDLKIRTSPTDPHEVLGVLGEGEKVLITGRVINDREEIVLDGQSRWVTFGYLSPEKPEPEPELGGECTNGTSVPGDLSPHIIAVHAAVCANFPDITTYGTWRPGDNGDHGSGRAVDIMVSGSRGWEIAEFLQANSSAFNINYLIYEQKIWQPAAGGGWEWMEDRGSATANHYDHVHVSVY